ADELSPRGDGGRRAARREFGDARDRSVHRDAYPPPAAGLAPTADAALPAPSAANRRGRKAAGETRPRVDDPRDARRRPEPGGGSRRGSVERAVKTARDIEIFGVVDRNEPVPEREIEDDEVDVELEIVGLAHAIDHRFGRHQIKADDLAIAVLRLERVRQFDVVDKQHIVADAELGLHAIGDGADRHGILHQEFGDAALLLTLLDERLVDAVAVSHAAGDDVVELVGRDALVGRAAADPEMHAAIDKTVAVEMHAIGAHAEKRHGTAIEPEDRLVAPARHHIKGLVAPYRDIALRDERLD